MMVGAVSVKRISLALTNCTKSRIGASTFSRVLLLKPTPRTLTTVPAGTSPSPGTTSVIETLPPTVTVPGETLAVDSPDEVDRNHVDCGSIANCVLVPGTTSDRIGSVIVIT